jgi:hypothetical protein
MVEGIMQDLLEIVEDLETLETWADTPGFHQALEVILPKWKARAAQAEEEMERQMSMLFD